MPKGVLNPLYEYAHSLAIEIGNDTHAATMRFMREIAVLKKFGDHEHIEREGFEGKKIIGYTLEEVVECWRWIRTREDFPVRDARLSTTLIGSPCNLQKYDQWIIDNLPPVWDSTEHDLYVRKYAKILSRLGFAYRGNRISNLELEQLGLRG